MRDKEQKTNRETDKDTWGGWGETQCLWRGVMISALLM